VAKKRNEYRLKINGRLVDVSEEIYNAHYQMNRHEQYLEETDRLHGKVLYSDMDNNELNGEEMLPDYEAVDLEEQVVTQMMIERLHGCLPLLSEDERELIDALFFSNEGAGMSEREYAKISGVPLMTTNDRKAKILNKLKKMMGN
jgi:DNA-directed RNA polymerase specialized sigma24 family protein